MKSLLEASDSISSSQNSSLTLSPQNVHRLDILRSWLTIAQKNSYDLETSIIGKHTLDIGCGQGDMVVAFAAALQSQGDRKSCVTGIDPASLDYGSPTTLGEAQKSIRDGPFSPWISFQQTTADVLVASQAHGTYSTAYFAHSLYYFPSSAVLLQTFRSLREAGVTTLLLAEWNLGISCLAAMPHLLSILLQSIDPIEDGNVRTVLSPDSYIKLAQQAGWELVGAETITPSNTLEDGKWECQFAREVAQNAKSSQLEAMAKGDRSDDIMRIASIRAHADAFEASVGAVGDVDNIQCMDVWTAVFKPKAID